MLEDCGVVLTREPSGADEIWMLTGDFCPFEMRECRKSVLGGTSLEIPDTVLLRDCGVVLTSDI